MKLPKTARIAALFQLADDLEAEFKTEENTRILSSVYTQLAYYAKAYACLREVANTDDPKDAKKLYALKDKAESMGDRWGMKRPGMKVPSGIVLPKFKYCSDPIGAGLFELVDEPQVCDCCEKATKVIYKGPFYAVANVKQLCPECIASGAAVQKFHGEFTDYALLSPEIDEEKKLELCMRNPVYIGWQQEYWPDHCDDFCEFIAYVGWEEIVEMGVADQIVEYIGIEEADREELINRGSCQGYLFRCLTCKKYVLYADFD